MLKKGVLFLFLGLFLISLVSANGLKISVDSVQINKTAGVDSYINLSIKNEETFKMFNISFSDTLLANKFDLNSGENKTIQFKISVDGNLDKDITLFGFYESNLGVSNNTKFVQINYPTGLSECGLNLVQGDKIIWQNNVLGEVTLMNTDTSQQIATILQNSNYTLNLDQAMNFNYYVTRIGSPFTPSCNVNVMGSSGLVHNSNYDDTLHLKLTINYEATTMSAFFLTDSYNLSYNEEYSDIFSLRNTGSKIAKNIHLESDWITFSQNDFDLSAGSSINIGYKIKPVVYETNQTNKWYNLTIRITGNFPTVEKNISVFVKYENIGAGLDNLLNIDPTILRYFIKKVCEDNPSFEECKKTIVYANGTGGNATITMTNEAWQKTLDSQVIFQDEVRSYIKSDNERQENQTSTLNEINSGFKESTKTVGELKESVDSSTALDVFYGVLVGSAIVIVGLVYIIYKKKGLLNIFKKGSYQQGETPT